MVSDTDLIARIVYSGDQHAFTSLVRKYQSPLRHFVRRLTDDASINNVVAYINSLR